LASPQRAMGTRVLLATLGRWANGQGAPVSSPPIRITETALEIDDRSRKRVVHFRGSRAPQGSAARGAKQGWLGIQWPCFTSSRRARSTRPVLHARQQHRHAWQTFAAAAAAGAAMAADNPFSNDNPFATSSVSEAGGKLVGADYAAALPGRSAGSQPAFSGAASSAGEHSSSGASAAQPQTPNHRGQWRGRTRRRRRPVGRCCAACRWRTC